MLRESLLIASILSTFVLCLDASAQPEQKDWISPSPALQQLFSQPHLHIDPAQRKWIVSYRWIVPGKEYESRHEAQIGEGRVTTWAMYPDGSLAGTDRDSVKHLGYLDQSGLPVAKFTFDGKSFESRLERVGGSFFQVSFENAAEPGKPAVWREVERAERRPLSMAEASQLLAQWELDRKKLVTPPQGFSGRMVQLPVDATVAVTLTKSDKWHGLGFRIVCARLPEGEGGPFRLNVNASGRVLSGLSPDCTYGGVHDREGGLSYRFYSTKEHPYVMVIGEKDTTLQLTLYRMSLAEVAQWKIDQRNEQIAANQREASSGDSGLFGALAMATGAALAGGNAEQVMGMAMKGAELTTDNEMSRNVLAGQGDAMVAAGTQRMVAENAHSTANDAASGSTELGPARNSASVTGTATTSARPRRKMFSWCWATAGGRAAYMSSVGSRDVSVDEQQQWRSAMESEFKQRISGTFDTVQCDIDDDSDFSYTRNSIAADKPAQMTWAPH